LVIMFTYNKYVLIDTFYFMFNWLTNTMGWPLERYHKYFAQVSVISIFNTSRVTGVYTLSSMNFQMSTRKNAQVWDLVIFGILQKACTNQEWRICPVLMIQLCIVTIYFIALKYYIQNTTKCPLWPRNHFVTVLPSSQIAHQAET